MALRLCPRQWSDVLCSGTCGRYHTWPTVPCLDRSLSRSPLQTRCFLLCLGLGPREMSRSCRSGYVIQKSTKEEMRSVLRRLIQQRQEQGISRMRSVLQNTLLAPDKFMTTSCLQAFCALFSSCHSTFVPDFHILISR